MTKAERYPVKKTRLEEYISRYESLTKVGYYYHDNKSPAKMFDTLEEAQAHKESIKRLEEQKLLSDYKLKLGEINEFPINIIDTLNLDLTSCVNEIEDRIEWLFNNTCFADREQFIFYKRFKEYLTLEEVSKLMGITRERVRQIEAKMLRKMKRFARYLELGEYADKLELAKQDYKTFVEEQKEQWTYESAKEFIREYENAHCGEIKKKQYCELDIDDLCLSIRSYNCLKRSGIYTVNQLIQISEEDLMRVRNLGKKSLREIKKELAEHDLELPERRICKKIHNHYGHKCFEFVGEE